MPLLDRCSTWKIHNAFHVQLLKTYRDPYTIFVGRQPPAPPPVLVQNELEYEVESVLAHRRHRNGAVEFLIRWKGYDPSEDSWVPESDMGNARRPLHDYLKLTVSRDVKFLESLYYKEWKQQQQKLPSTPLIVEADEVQQPSRQVEVAVSEEEMSGVTEEGGAAEVEQQQQQQHESPPRVPHPPERPRRDVRPP
ncbi:hypothetical protein CLOP_g13204, partial [Closterium sp. NIES-67]